MGQKVDPRGFRLGYSRPWDSSWYAEKSRFASNLIEDTRIRKVTYRSLETRFVSKVLLERLSGIVSLTIHTSRPGLLIGKNGKEIELLRSKLKKEVGLDIQIKVTEVTKPECDAALVAKDIACQLSQRISYRRVLKKAVSNLIRGKGLGIKICISGRINGAEIARSVWERHGSVPLHTLRANVDYFATEAITTYGMLGVKVWICRSAEI